MDVYHKVLIALYKITEGRDSKAVDFKDLVKKNGFHANYSNIFEYLSGEGWIAEERQADFVRITHWGIAESKKAQKGDEKTGDSDSIVKNANACAEAAKEFAELMENFARDGSKNNLEKAGQKFAEMETLFNLAKTHVR